jgi:hypothetical protein
MKKFSAPVLYIILAIGILCILAGLVLPVVFFSDIPTVSLYRCPIIMLFLGGLLLYLSLAFTHRAHQLFLGMNLCFSGFLILVFRAGLVTVSFRELWPVCVIFCGLTLVPSGYFRYRTIRTMYLFPAILLIFLGLFFCLFSFHIIRMPLREFISIWWPVVLIFIGGLLIGTFQYQRNFSSVFPYMTDNSGTDTEMDISSDDDFDDNGDGK